MFKSSRRKNMKSILIATVACVLCAGSPTQSFAEEEHPVDTQATSVEASMADLESRIEQLEAKIGGETVESAFQPRGSRTLHLRAPAQASSQD
jgi:hypothetical protein